MASSSALCTLKERRQYEGSSVLQARQNMHEEQRASTQCTKEAQMRGHERSEEEDKSREREVDGGGTTKEAHEKSSIEARRGGHVGSTSGEGRDGVQEARAARRGSFCCQG